MNLDSPFMYEVLNYYTLQSLHSCSDKKTVPIFKDLSLKGIDIQSDMTAIAKHVAKELSLAETKLLEAYTYVKKSFSRLLDSDLIVRKGMEEYPDLLAKTDDAPPYLFLRGKTDLLKRKIVCVVGSRNASKDGLEKAYRLANLLGKAGIVVASGLASGIDTSAHKGALENNHLTIAVIGTPLTKFYPRENEDLQKKISEVGLVVSQFPPSSPTQRWHFPMRNAVMSGISLATTIVEAGETSGALRQADSAIKQGRLIFIPQSLTKNNNLNWPNRYLQRKQAYTFSRIEELLGVLENAELNPSKESQASLF